jgi:flagellar hook-length control protein FliK
MVDGQTAVKIATDAALDARPKVTVVRQEAHFAPAALPTAEARIAEAMQVLASGTAPSKTAASGEPKAPAKTSSVPQSAAVAGGDRNSPQVQFAAARAVVSPESATGAGTPEDQAGGAAPETVAVRQSGQPAMAMPPPPPAVQQIADQIAAELGANGTTPSYGTLLTPNLTLKPAPGSVLKVLHIQLQPAELGLVTVRMSLKDDAIQVQLDAVREDTAELIRKDRDALSNLLRSAGLQVDGVVVQIAEPDRTAGAQASPQFNGAQSQSQSSMQSPSGGAQTDGRPSGSRSETGSGSQSSPGNRDDSHDGRVTSRSDGALYV